MNIVRTDKNDQMHIKSWVMKLWFLCVGPECCLCSLRYLKCATASFQRFFLHSGTTTHKAPSHSDPTGYTGNALVCPRVRFKGTPPTSAKAKFTRVWPFLKRHIFIRIHVDVVRYKPVFSVVGQRSSPLTSVDWRLYTNRLVWTRTGSLTALESGGFCDRIHWFRVDARPIRVRKYVVSKVSRFVWT